MKLPDTKIIAFFSALLFLTGAAVFAFKSGRPPVAEITVPVKTAQVPKAESMPLISSPHVPGYNVPKSPEEVLSLRDLSLLIAEDIVPALRAEGEVENAAPPVPLWKKNAVAVNVPASQPRVVIIIDDMGDVGMDAAREAIALPGPVTLSYLPYVPGIQALVDEGRAAGHEIMMHMPMEALSGENDNSSFLRVDMDAPAFMQQLNANLNSFEGYVGINNHMGSRLVQDKKAMEMVMGALKERGLLFIDSRTIATTVGEEIAAHYGIPHGRRHVFLDHFTEIEHVRAALAHLEEIARRQGHAVAIGHPKPATLQALKEWLPTLKEKNIALVPASAVVAMTPGDAALAPQL